MCLSVVSFDSWLVLVDTQFYCGLSAVRPRFVARPPLAETAARALAHLGESALGVCLLHRAALAKREAADLMRVLRSRCLGALLAFSQRRLLLALRT